ncbi:unnamed protein product [Ambrosiozyma monospora]|uniref:Unnamed protein product n=1 Tax=Ambrosiozyma monospora TaxID=43982 RepID=A0ACB5UDQ5_AMBMO|nr:unnamed protein product [Ambrosiozyma monospora]
MSEEEKLNRWQAMYNTVSKQDSLYWIKTCLVDIQNASEYNENIQSSDLETLTQDSFNEKYDSITPRGKRLIILNLGSLTTNLEIQGTTINLIQQHHLDSTINHLTSDTRNSVFLLGYSERFDLLRKHGRLQDAGLIAENGGFIKMPHSGSTNSSSGMDANCDLNDEVIH